MGAFGKTKKARLQIEFVALSYFKNAVHRLIEPVYGIFERYIILTIWSVYSFSVILAFIVVCVI